MLITCPAALARPLAHSTIPTPAAGSPAPALCPPGARYHTELSRQLADFLEGPLARCGGMISLPDVYCLFNRARGTELVSPDDLLQVGAGAGGKGGGQGWGRRGAVC